MPAPFFTPRPLLFLTSIRPLQRSYLVLALLQSTPIFPVRLFLIPAYTTPPVIPPTAALPSSFPRPAHVKSSLPCAEFLALSIPFYPCPPPKESTPILIIFDPRPRSFFGRLRLKLCLFCFHFYLRLLTCSCAFPPLLLPISSLAPRLFLPLPLQFSCCCLPVFSDHPATFPLRCLPVLTGQSLPGLILFLR